MLNWDYCGGWEFYQRSVDRVTVFRFESGVVLNVDVDEDGKCTIDTDEELPLFMVSKLAEMLQLDAVEDQGLVLGEAGNG